LICPSKWLLYAIAFRVPKVNEVFFGFKIELAEGEHLDFRSLKTHFIGQDVVEYI
jgi:hypothetical protein